MQRQSPPKHRHDGTSPLPLGMDWSPPPRKWNGRDTVWPHDHRTGWSYCVMIPSWVVLPKSRDSDPVVFYRVQIGVQSPDGVTTTRGVLRRFNDFLKLFGELKKAYPKKSLPPAPPKGLLRMRSRALLDERRCSLEEWMTKLLSDIDLSRSFAVAAFLELEAAARSSFQEANQNSSEAFSGNSSAPSTQLLADSGSYAIAGSSSITPDYGSDTAYETSEVGTPKVGRDDSSETGIEDLALEEDMSNPMEKLVKYGISNIDEGLFMGQAILEQLGGFPTHKVQVSAVNDITGRNAENGHASKVSYLSGNDLELFSEHENIKITGHARRLSADSSCSDVSSLRSNDMSNVGLSNLSGSGSFYLPGGAETASASDMQYSGDGQLILPMDQRNKLNRVLLTMQRRLVTSKTDMEDLIGRLNQEIAVKDYLTRKVKDLEVELDSTKQKSKETLEQALLAERERLTQMQWDMEELRQRSYEMELKLKSKQDGASSSELAGKSFTREKDEVSNELDATKEHLSSLQKRYEELEARSKADVKVLVKEVKSLRSSQTNLRQELALSEEAKSKFQKLLKEEKERNDQAKTAWIKLIEECESLHNLIQECNTDALSNGMNHFEALQSEGPSEDRIGLIVAQAQMLAQADSDAAPDYDEGSEVDMRKIEEGLRKIVSNIIIDHADLRKQVKSMTEKFEEFSSSGRGVTADDKSLKGEIPDE